MSVWSAIIKRADVLESSPRRRLKSKGQGKGERWTKNEDALIVRWYGKKPIAWLAQKLRRTVPAVRTHARGLGMKLRKKTLWTPEDDALLQEWYGKKPLEWIMKRLGRTKNSIRMRATQLGIRRRILGYTHQVVDARRLRDQETVLKLR
jgi:hypothetical protein